MLNEKYNTKSEEDRIWMLLSLKLANEATDDELCELNQLLASNPGIGYKCELIMKIWHCSPEKEMKNADELFLKIIEKAIEKISE